MTDSFFPLFTRCYNSHSYTQTHSLYIITVIVILKHILYTLLYIYRQVIYSCNDVCNNLRELWSEYVVSEIIPEE